MTIPKLGVLYVFFLNNVVDFIGFPFWTFCILVQWLGMIFAMNGKANFFFFHICTIALIGLGYSTVTIDVVYYYR